MRKTFKDKSGETKVASNGQRMTIIAYRNYHDIDVQFEDGTIVKSKNYKEFKKGYIRNPNCIVKRKRKPYKNRVGEVHVATNGQKMTIVAYRGSRDVDVQFEDNTIVKNKVYDSFLKGKIANPNKRVITKNAFKTDRVEKSNIANNGQKMMIIAYRGSNDMDVQFEDGTIVKNRRYDKFKKGSIKNPNLVKKRNR